MVFYSHYPFQVWYFIVYIVNNRYGISRSRHAHGITVNSSSRSPTSVVNRVAVSNSETWRQEKLSKGDMFVFDFAVYMY